MIPRTPITARTATSGPLLGDGAGVLAELTCSS
jgi:hypothetical protein